MTGADQTRCTECGLLRRDHIRPWMPGPGWHVFKAPTAEQALRRHLARFPRQRTAAEES
ncbi:hypothetical protein ACGF07_25720 [Kitasatospora sp. NPDC048194]|uniref:hypothetical protein n=1 Tax=Kitasatospora sp. NPDC048194 TaxID=3364045 RepID=UPI0037242AD1